MKKMHNRKCSVGRQDAASRQITSGTPAKPAFHSDINMFTHRLTKLGFISALSLTALSASVFGQDGSGMDGGETISVLIGATVVLAGVAFVFYRRGKQADPGKSSSIRYNYEDRLVGSGAAGLDNQVVDIEQELKMFRKVRKDPNAKRPDRQKIGIRMKSAEKDDSAGKDEHLDTKAFQARLRKHQYNQLPINSFLQLNEPRPFTQLPISSDPALLSAIEQVSEEDEDDEMIRELALKILSQFKTRNSVEALSEIALYDISSNLRSRAVTTLAEMDHESVFEVILLACADPSREVRAAAARGLFRLKFDRADSWKRIIASHDEYRMRQAARAAAEADIVKRSFERLIHQDMKIAYEAFALVGLLIRSGEVEEIFDALRNVSDQRIKFALIHTLKSVPDDKVYEKLDELCGDPNISDEIREQIKEMLDDRRAVVA